MSCPDTVSQDQINQAVSLLQELFPQELTGIYLYGSAVLDGLRPESDIDILVIIDRPLTQSLRARLTQELLCPGEQDRSYAVSAYVVVRDFPVRRNQDFLH